jgi:hypothetical protein
MSVAVQSADAGAIGVKYVREQIRSQMECAHKKTPRVIYCK